MKRVVWDQRKGWLISLSYDRSVVLWRYEAGTLTRLAHSSLPSIIWPRSCAFLGDERIAFVTFGSTYAVWDHTTDTWDLEGIDHAISLNAVSIHNGHTYAIGDAGKLLIDGQPSTLIGSLCNFLLPFGEEMLTGGQMGQVYDAVTGRLIHQHRSPLNCATVQGGFASIGRDLKLRIWSGDASQVYETPHVHSVKCIAASADQQVIATGSYGGTVALFDLQQRRWTHRVKPTTSGISCITYSPQDGLFLASSYDGQLYPISVSA